MRDFTAQRYNMVDGQILPNGVTDPRIIEAMLCLPREIFVDPAMQMHAYLDEEILLECGRFLLAPMLLAKMVQALNITESDRILDIGAASGYSTALLSKLGKTVTSLIEPPAIVPWATENLKSTDCTHNTTVLNDPLYDGYAPNAPYNAILINGGVEILPDVLLNQLDTGGRLIAVHHNHRTGESCATLWQRHSGGISHRPLFDAWCGCLSAFAAPQQFQFGTL